MDERKAYILSAIIETYLANGRPIGSRTLKRDFNLDVSAATIRNDMSDLEHEGFLEKAHTSSGRIPSEKAYRLFVDELLRKKSLQKPVAELGSQSLLKESHDPVNIVGRALEILSDLSDLTAFSYSSALPDDRLKTIRLIPLSDQEMMLVSIYESKHIQTDLLHLSGTYSQDRLERVGVILRELFEGRKIEELLHFLHAESFSGQYIYGNLLTELVPAISARMEERLLDRLEFRGIGKWLRYVDEENLPGALDFLNRLRAGDRFKQYLKDLDLRDGMNICIGSENPLPELRETSIIVFPYHLKSRPAGYMGLIGPKRMNYKRAIEYSKRIGRYVDSILARA